MLFLKKCNDFHYLFSLKIGLEIRFNNIMNRKETFLNYKNKIFTTSQKWHFSKGVNPCFWSKNAIFFHYLLSLKIRLKLRVNNVLDGKKKLFLTIKTKFFSLKTRTHAFVKKKCHFLLIFFRSNQD